MVIIPIPSMYILCVCYQEYDGSIKGGMLPQAIVSSTCILTQNIHTFIYIMPDHIYIIQ